MGVRRRSDSVSSGVKPYVDTAVAKAIHSIQDWFSLHLLLHTSRRPTYIAATAITVKPYGHVGQIYPLGQMLG